MNTSPDPAFLSIRFCENLNKLLDPTTIAEINRRNGTKEYSGYCASHDFCDPNQAMIDALQSLGFEYQSRLNEVINNAWSCAKAVGFSIEAIQASSPTKKRIKLATIKQEYLSNYSSDLTYVVVEEKDEHAVVKLLNFPERPAIEVPTLHLRVFDEIDIEQQSNDT